jgi:hypothetical protein
MSALTPDDKRQLAEMLIPYLAWDLSRAQIWVFNPATMSATANEVTIHQIDTVMRAKVTSGEGFRIAIIPTTTARLNPAR